MEQPDAFWFAQPGGGDVTFNSIHEQSCQKLEMNKKTQKGGGCGKILEHEKIEKIGIFSPHLCYYNIETTVTITHQSPSPPPPTTM